MLLFASTSSFLNDFVDDDVDDDDEDEKKQDKEEYEVVLAARLLEVVEDEVRCPEAPARAFNISFF